LALFNPILTRYLLAETVITDRLAIMSRLSYPVLVFFTELTPEKLGTDHNYHHLILTILSENVVCP